MSAADRESFVKDKKYAIEMIQISLNVHRETLARFDLLHASPPTPMLEEIRGHARIIHERNDPAYKITTFDRLLLTRIFDEYFE